MILTSIIALAMAAIGSPAALEMGIFYNGEVTAHISSEKVDAKGKDAKPAKAAVEMIDIGKPETIVKWLQDNGYKAELDKDDLGDPLIVSGSSGTTFVIYFYECENGKDCRSLQFEASYGVKKKNNYENINKYNKEFRWGKGHIDKEGDPILRMDIDAEQRVISSVMFEQHMSVWEETMGNFEGVIFDEK